MSRAMDLGADRAVRVVLIVFADITLLARPTRPLHSGKVYYVNLFLSIFSVCRCHALRARRPLHS